MDNPETPTKIKVRKNRRIIQEWTTQRHRQIKVRENRRII